MITSGLVLMGFSQGIGDVATGLLIVAVGTFDLPVSDVDRAKAFYTEKIGFHADHDHRVNDQLRFVQLTPPGSACSIALGTGLSGMAPGSVQGLQLVVPDVHAARAELLERGVEVGEVQE